MILNFQRSTLDFLRRHWLAILTVAVLLLAGWKVFSVLDHAREIRQAIARGALQAEISNLRLQVTQAENRAGLAAVRAHQLTAEIAEKEKINRQLTAELERLRTKAAAEQAQIAKLPLPELATRLGRDLNSEFRILNSELITDEAGARKIAGAVADRDACVQLSTLNSQLLLNCRSSLTDYTAVAEQQALQIQDLKQALDLEKRAFHLRENLAKKEVKTAKGSWLRRSWEKIDGPVLFVAGGLGGFALGRAAR